MAPAGDQGAAGGEQVAAGGVIMHAGIAARFSLPHPASAGAMWPLQVKRGDAESGGRPGGMLLCRGKAAPPFPALALPCPCSQKKPHRVLLVIRHHYNSPPPSSLPPSLPPSLPVQKPPTPGLVSAIAGFINLVSSKEPLLELRGCQGLARICYAPPYGCPPPAPSSSSSSTPGGGGGVSGHLDEAKAVIALLGGVQACLGGGRV